MRLLIDMNLSPHWVAAFKEAGIDAVHWSMLGAFNATDAAIMAYARQHDCVVATHDLDFGAILAATQGEKPSVVQIRADDVSPTAIGSQVINALKQMSMELDSGALLIVDPSRTRLRVLPLQLRH